LGKVGAQPRGEKKTRGKVGAHNKDWTNSWQKMSIGHRNVTAMAVERYWSIPPFRTARETRGRRRFRGVTEKPVANPRNKSVEKPLDRLGTMPREHSGPHRLFCEMVRETKLGSND